MLKRFTFWFTLMAVLSSLLHFLGIDKDHVIFLHISIPAWIIGLFADLQSLSALFLYLITILFWFTFGYLCDWLLRRKANNIKSK